MTLLARDLACQQAVELITDYLEGTLARKHRRRLERHLRACENCSTYLEQIRASIALSGQVDPDRLDPATREGLMDLYRKYRS
ncbi:MAG TPA: zf-HC2 domain-containing protein [Mycobacteriales bacterium]|nr:zf-HC2 domain-containing protein [Mycobacteriales bacterium]